MMKRNYPRKRWTQRFPSREVSEERETLGQVMSQGGWSPRNNNTQEAIHSISPGHFSPHREQRLWTEGGSVAAHTEETK